MTDRSRLLAAGQGALLGTLVGDCLGGPYEGSSPVSVAKAWARIEQALRRAPLPFSDDTQLAVALAQHVLEVPDVEPGGFAAWILHEFEPHRGYGAGMRSLVEEWRRGVPLAEAATAVFAEGSFGNGAAMRVAPLAVRFAEDPDRLEEAVLRSAELTHAHPIGRDGALSQARAVALAATRGRFGVDELAVVADGATTPELGAGMTDAGALLLDWSGDQSSAVATAGRRLGTDVTAHRSVPAALWAAVAGGDPSRTIALSVALGGDVDTIAAMSAAVRAAADGPDALPADWLAACEGVDRVRELGRQLAEAAA